MRRLSAVVALCLVAAACSGSAEDATTTTAAPAGPRVFTSADDRLQVTSADPDAPDITIDPVEEGDLPFGDADLLAAYDLGPSGTEFSSPLAVEFVAGETTDPGSAAPLIAAFVESTAGEWEILPTTTAHGDDGLVVTTELGHFSRLVFLGAEQALFLDPDAYFGYVGDEWDAYWDLFDRRFVYLTNDRGRLGLTYDADLDRRVPSRVRDLSDAVDIEVAPTYSGVVDLLDEVRPRLGTYDYMPVAGVDLFPRTPAEWVEIFYGVDAFVCDAAGRGTYGFDVDIYVDRPDLLFAGRTLSGQVVFVRPSDGVLVRYSAEADAYCKEGARGLHRLLLYRWHGVSARLVDGLQQMDDPAGDGIYSISRVLAGLFERKVDLRLWFANRLTSSELTNDHLYNQSVFGCGTTVDDEALGTVTTICTAEPTEIPEGEVVIVSATYDDALPGEGDTSHYTYAAVFESNDDPSDDWQPQGDFDWDFFIGTDRWYQLHWNPGRSAWQLAVSDGLTPAVSSGARVLIAGDTLIWVIPKDELPADEPEVRVTSFVHDGTYRPEVSGGDVSGADPTEPLVPVEFVGG